MRASLTVLILLLTACVEEDLSPPVSCDGVDVVSDEYGCSLVGLDCTDGALHELLCNESSGSSGAYEFQLVCDCAEERATYGVTSIQGATCGDADEDLATLEAAFRACGRDLTLE